MIRMLTSMTPAVAVLLASLTDLACASSSSLRGSIANASEDELPRTNESAGNDTQGSPAALELYARASCCSKCSGSDFCSPYSRRCYNGKKWQRYWLTCGNSPAPAPSAPTSSSGDSCCNQCSGHDWCSPYSRRCYDGHKWHGYWLSCGGAPRVPAPPAAPQAPAPPIPTAAPPLVPPSSSQDDVVRKGVMTLYHTTSPEIADLIVASNFKPGSSGWCGGATYFVDYPGLPKSKISPEYTSLGAVIEAKVDLGTMCLSKRPDDCNDASAEADGKCCPMPGGGMGIVGAKESQCSSIRFDPGDGNEYIVWNPDQVLSKKIWCTGIEECRQKCTASGFSAGQCGY